MQSMPIAAREGAGRTDRSGECRFFFAAGVVRIVLCYSKVGVL